MPRADIRARSLRAVLGALALFAYCGAAGASETSWRAQLNEAERLASEGRSEEAAKKAQGVLADADKSLPPDGAEINRVLSRLGRIYAQAQDATPLPEIERRLAAIKAKDFDVWLGLGMILREEGKPAEAEDALKKASALRPDNPGADYALAQVYDDMGRFEEEIRLLKKRIEERPHDYLPYSQLARVYIRLGRSAEAKATYARAKRMNGGEAQAYIDAGYFDLNSGERDGAKDDFASAIAADTGSPAGYHHMGAYYALNQQYPEAEKYFLLALKKLEADPNAAAKDLLHTLHSLGDVLQKQGLSAEAEAVFRKCLDHPAPNHVYVLCLRALADIYDSQGRPAPAVETLERAAAACADGPACSCRARALIGLARFHLNHGRRSEAAAMVNDAAKLCSSQNEFDAPIFSELEGLYGRLGDAAKEEAFYARVMAERSSRQFFFILPVLADRDMTRGRFSEAEDLYRQGIRIFKNRGDGGQEAAMFDGLAAACEKEAKLREAAEARERARALRAGH